MTTADEARLLLAKVRINRRAGNLYVFDDRIEIVTDTGNRIIPMHELERLTTRRSWRGAKLLLALTDGEIIDVRRLAASHASRAHRTIIAIARGEQ